jgi:hypothetical protein
VQRSRIRLPNIERVIFAGDWSVAVERPVVVEGIDACSVERLLNGIREGFLVLEKQRVRHHFPDDPRAGRIENVFGLTN